jgi:hypothetical protein
MARRAPYGKAPPTWQRPYIMRWIEAASAGTPARAQPAPPLIRLWRFPCPFQRRTAERYKGAAISVLTLPCQDGTDSSNPLSSSKESSNFRYRSLGTADGARRLDADAAGCAGVGTGCVRRPFGPACSSSAPKSRTPHGEDSNRASERSASRANDQRRRHQGPPRPHQTGDTRP